MERAWALKPCLNCNPSRELDALIQETVAASRDNLSFNDLLKKLIYKHSDLDASSVADFMTALMQICSPKSRILAITALVKSNKEAKVDNLV